MWIKTGNIIRLVKGGETVYLDGRLIRIRVRVPGDVSRDVKVGAYKSEERARAVLWDFWAKIRSGEDSYEFPEE